MADGLKNYPNPLDNFRSYSYHFILTLSSTSEALRKQVGPQAKPLYSTVQGVKLGGEIRLGDGDSAWLVLDTRRFSQYSITEFDVEHMYGTGDPNNPSVPRGSTWLKVIDTTGFTFFNFVQDLLKNKVKSSLLSSFFLLNVMFVGHRDDDTTEVISTCYMPLMLTTFGAEVDARGSVCTLQFIENEGGFDRDSPVWQLTKLGTQVTVTTDPGKNTVADMINALEDKLNENSLNFYQKYAEDDKQRTNGAPARGKLVQYMFNLPDEWSSDKYKVTSAAISKRIEQQFLAPRKAATTTEQKQAVEAEVKVVQQEISFDKSGASQMAFSEKTTIADALTKILTSSDAILDQASAEKRRANNPVTFKIATNITSDANTYIIHYDIYPYRLAAPQIQETRTTDRMIDDSNVIYYDYIFTGKNSHLEDLKIVYSPTMAWVLESNPELGSSRMQKMSSVGQRTTEVDAEAVRNSPTGGTRELRANDPVIPTAGSIAQQTNFTHQRETEQFGYSQSQRSEKLHQEYMQTMAFSHMLGSMNMDITIRGNPNLLRKFADRNMRQGVAQHGMPETFKPNELTNLHKVGFTTVVRSALSSAKQQYRRNYYGPRVQVFRNTADGSTLGDDPLIDNSKDVLAYPIFVKLNIRTPDIDWSDQMEGGQQFIDDPQKFYSGPWRVLFVKHTFIDGEFKQQLNLIPAEPDMRDEEKEAAIAQRRKVV